MKKIFFILVVATAIIVGCSKTSNPPTQFLEYNKFNLAGKYQITDLTFKTFGDTGVEVDVYDLDTVFSDCKKDDLIVFDTSNLFTYIDSMGTICDSADLIDFNNYAITNTNLISGIRTFEPSMLGPQTYLITSLTVNELNLSRLVEVPILGNLVRGTMRVKLTRKP